VRLVLGSVGENMDELAKRITEYAATVDEANKRTLDPIIVELMRDRGLTYVGIIGATTADFLAHHDPGASVDEL